MYEKELNALLIKDRFRERRIYTGFADFASNDYLGLSSNKKQLQKAYNRVLKADYYAPRASGLVCGYSKIHAKFEKTLCEAYGFESAAVFGSGFLANHALVSTLPRKKDFVLMDEEYHASGIAALDSCVAKYEFFDHNDPDALEQKLRTAKGYERIFIFVESVYSMMGDVVDKKIFELADLYGVVLVVDEAHGVGTLGKNLLGAFDLYGIAPKPNHIKMGTLGKALGSYGAYVLASSQVISFLENRAKSLIYTTALSIFDTALAHENFKYLQKNGAKLKTKLDSRLGVMSDTLQMQLLTPIAMLADPLNQTKKSHNALLKSKILTGFIRPPTVKSPMIRAVVGLAAKQEEFEKFVLMIKKLDLRAVY
jgi:8-amino-7-oxononanoate synthase